jgi:chromosome segregation ATPase
VSNDLEQPLGFWARAKRWFTGHDASLPKSHAIVHVRRSILPWRRTESEIADLQKNVEALTQAMLSLRDHLEHQTRQHEELGEHLEKISQTNDIFPATATTPDEALRAIASQMAYQSQQQNRLANILEKLTDSGTEQGRALHSLMDRMESLEHHKEILSENVQSMGIVLQTVNRNSEQTAQNTATTQEHAEHHTQLLAINYRQNVWMLILIGVTLALAIAAIVISLTMGSLIFRRMRGLSHPVGMTQYLQASDPGLHSAGRLY